MANQRENTGGFELICLIVNHGKGSFALQTAKQAGLSGGTVMLGTGTVKNPLLEFLCIADIKKEIIYMVADRDTAYRALDIVAEKLKLFKRNHGIAYTTPVCTVEGARKCRCAQFEREKGVVDPMYHAITVIVDKGKAEQVVEVATRAGSKGGTVINGRGSGIHETSKVFSMDIEPEKEIVLILSKADRTESIVASIAKEMKIDLPGNGIIYVQDVNRTYGLYEAEV